MNLSIIIPVYNTEKYISKCLESCLSQGIDEKIYEIIIIDDGSTDNSLNIIKDFEKKDNNITVISQENKKQGAARNNGLGIAKGEYIWFVDSDDWIEPDAISSILNYLSTWNLDILRFDAVDHKPNGIMLRPCKHIPNHLYARHEALLEDEISVCVPFHIFKKSFLQENRLTFIENIFYEDNEFMLRAYEKVESFSYLRKSLYNVLFRDNSTTRTLVYSRNLYLLKVIESHIEYLNFNEHKKKIKKIFGLHVARCMNSLLSGVSRSEVLFNEAIKSLRRIEDLSVCVKNSKSLFHIIEFYLLKHPFILRKLLLKFYKN